MNSPVTGEFPAQRPVARGFGVFFDLRLNNAWVNNREAGDLRRHHALYDVKVMEFMLSMYLVLGDKISNLMQVLNNHTYVILSVIWCWQMVSSISYSEEYDEFSLFYVTSQLKLTMICVRFREVKCKTNRELLLFCFKVDPNSTWWYR